MKKQTVYFAIKKLSPLLIQTIKSLLIAFVLQYIKVILRKSKK